MILDWHPISVANGIESGNIKPPSGGFYFVHCTKFSCGTEKNTACYSYCKLIQQGDRYAMPKKYYQ